MAEGHSRRGALQRFVSWSRYIILIDVIGLFAAFVALMVSSVWHTFRVIWEAAFSDGLSQKELVGSLVQQADTALLAAVFYVIALGLYSLFVDDKIPMPTWLRVRNLGDLKELLASVVIVVVAVIFLGFALTWDGVQNLLIIGLSSAAVIAALALFLWTTGKERAHRDELELRRAESRCVQEAVAAQQSAVAGAGWSTPGEE
jgi:uncharacterized membrane protein YqhA